MTSTLASKIESFLSPLLGYMMAHSAVKLQCKKIGVLPDELKTAEAIKTLN